MIEFNSILFIPQLSTPNGVQQSIRVNINFKDGDGNLGIDTVNGNEKDANYFVTFFIKNPDNTFSRCTGDICGVSDTVLNLYSNGFFPVLNPSDKPRPLSGILTYDLKSSGWAIAFKDKTIRLRVKIKDQAGNFSNEVDTDTLKF